MTRDQGTVSSWLSRYNLHLFGRARKPWPAPDLPYDIVYAIIRQFWSSRLSRRDRRRFMASSILVSKTWSSIYYHVSSVDTHIPCGQFYFHFFNDTSRDFSRCTRITFTFNVFAYPRFHRRGAISGDHSPSPLLIGMTLFDMNRLTSLQTINLVFYNRSTCSPCVTASLLALPAFIPRLTISYVFSKDIPRSVIYGDSFPNPPRCVTFGKRFNRWRLGTLEINGAPESTVIMWEGIFPEYRRLIVDGRKQKLEGRWVPDYPIMESTKYSIRREVHRRKEFCLLRCVPPNHQPDCRATLEDMNVSGPPGPWYENPTG